MKHPRDDWRLNSGQGENQGVKFDEIVVGAWLHVERMNTRMWWLRLGNREADVTVDAKGNCQVRWRDG